jgi:hypothetical protein
MSAEKRRTRARLPSLERRIARIERAILVPSYEGGQTVIVSLPRVEFLERKPPPMSDRERPRFDLLVDREGDR